MKRRVYIAGPDVFRSDAKEELEYKAQMCRYVGLVPLTPLDNNIPDGLTKLEQAEFIYSSNMELIRSADAIIADITPFRGISCDPGTAFEIGAAKALGKVVYLYSDQYRCYHRYKDRVDMEFPDPHMLKEHPIVEDFGLADNLMIALSGKKLVYGGFNSVLVELILDND